MATGRGEGPEPRPDAREARPSRWPSSTVHRLDRGRPAAHGPAGLKGPGEPDPGHDLRDDERTRASRRGPRARAGRGGRTRRPGRAWPRPHLLARCLLRRGRPAEAREVLGRSSRGRDARRGIMPAARPVRPPGAQASCRRGPETGSRKTATCIRSRRNRPPTSARRRCAECHRANLRFPAEEPARPDILPRQGNRLARLLAGSARGGPADSKVSHRYHKAADHVEVETRIDDRIVRTIVDYAFGSGDRGMTLVGHNEQEPPLREPPVVLREPGGVGRNLGPECPSRPECLVSGSLLNLDVVRRCILCHQTNPMAVLLRTGPEAADPAIGCERCHGPGGIISSLSRPRLNRRTWPSPALRWPGASPSSRSAASATIPARSRSSLADERDRDPVSGIVADLEPMLHRERRKLDCVTCHNPHRDADTKARHYEAKCLGCHSDETPAKSHSICPIQPKSGCVSCHMPKETSPIPHSRFTDHYIRVRHDSNPVDSPAKHEAGA